MHYMRNKSTITGLLVALAFGAFTAGASYAQQTPPETGGTPTHQQMHEMMDEVHGDGTSQRMHEAMGDDAEKMMDQCVGMMGMMRSSGGTTNGPMPGMMSR